MSLTKEIKKEIQAITGEFNHIHIKEETQVYEDDKPIGSPSNHRYFISPGGNVDNEPEKIRLTCAIWHTEEIVTAYKMQKDKAINT